MVAGGVGIAPLFPIVRSLKAERQQGHNYSWGSHPIASFLAEANGPILR